jgi:hypothetical protein
MAFANKPGKLERFKSLQPEAIICDMAELAWPLSGR